MSNKNLIQELDQQLHNEGVSKQQRYSDLFKMMLALTKLKSEENQNLNDLLLLDQTTVKKLLSDSYASIAEQLELPAENLKMNLQALWSSLPLLISLLDQGNKQVIQDFFMHFAPQFLKQDFDQYWTPVEIADFFASIIEITEETKIIDPAGGSGDFLAACYLSNDANPMLVHWDQSEDANRAAKLSFHLNGIRDAKFQITDSIENSNLENGQFDFCVTNPPFGTKTTWARSKPISIMEEYEMGHKWSNEGPTEELFNQQLGILFIERSMKLLKDLGILLIVLPSGYMSNASESYIRRWLFERHRPLAVISLPGGAFSGAGAGVSTDLVLVQKGAVQGDYEILVDEAKSIGFDFTRKSSSKLYKRDPYSGKILEDDSGQAIPDNDLILVAKRVRGFARKNNVQGLLKSDFETKYSRVLKSKILEKRDLNLSPKRYLNFYGDSKEKLVVAGGKSLAELGFEVQPKSNWKPTPNETYLYLDIGEVTQGSYREKNFLKGWELPGRARQPLAPGDLLVSRLAGSIGKFCLYQGSSAPAVATTGLFVIKNKNQERLHALFAFLFSDAFRLQFSSLATGSIMEDVKADVLLGEIIMPGFNTQQLVQAAQKILRLQRELNSLVQGLQ
jgi:type I restriction enzyme M protein